MLTKQQQALRQALLLTGTMEALVACGKADEVMAHFDDDKLLDLVTRPLLAMKDSPDELAIEYIVAIFNEEFPEAVKAATD